MRACFRRSATACMPVSSISQRLSSVMSSSAPCTVFSGCSGWISPKPGQPRHFLVQARIVLHRARAERKDAGVDRVVLLREAHIVANGLRLGKTRQADGSPPLQACPAASSVSSGSSKSTPVRLRRADLENKRLLNGKTAVAREGSDVDAGRIGRAGVFRHLNHEGPPSARPCRRHIIGVVTSVAATTIRFSSAVTRAIGARRGRRRLCRDPRAHRSTAPLAFGVLIVNSLKKAGVITSTPGTSPKALASATALA